MTPESQIATAVITGILTLLTAFLSWFLNRERGIEQDKLQTDLHKLRGSLDERLKFIEHRNKINEMMEIERVKAAKEILDKTIEYIARARNLHSEYPKHIIEVIANLQDTGIMQAKFDDYKIEYLKFKTLDGEFTSLAYLWFTTDCLKHVHWFKNSDEIEEKMHECYDSVMLAILSVRKALVLEHSIVYGEFKIDEEGQYIFFDTKGKAYDQALLKKALEECIQIVLSDIDGRKNMISEVRNLKNLMIKS